MASEHDMSLMSAAQDGHVEEVLVQLNKGADVDTRIQGLTPLILASQCGHPRVVSAA